MPASEFAQMLEMDGRPGDSTSMAESRQWPPMSYYARIALTVLAVATVVVIVLVAAWAVRNILVLVLVAAVIAIGLDPAVRQLERWHFRRGWAVVAIFFAGFLFVVLFLSLVIPPLVREVGDLATDIPDKLRHSTGFIGDLQRKYHLAQKFEDLTKNLPQIAGNSFKTILGLTKSVGAIIFNLLTIGILTIYFLMALPRARKTAVELMPAKERRRGS